MDLAGTYLVNTSDPDEAAAILATEYGPMRITRASPETAWIRIWRTRVGPMTLDDADITSHIRVDLDAPRGIVLCRIRAGSIAFGEGEHQKSFVRGDLVAILSDGVPLTGTMSHARCDLVSFDPSMLEAMATQDAESRCGQRARRFAVPVSPSAGQLVGDVIDHIRTFVANNPLVAGDALVATSAARYLAATTLAAFPGSALRF